MIVSPSMGHERRVIINQAIGDDNEYKMGVRVKSYLIDEISSSDVKRVREELERRGLRSGLADIFWVRIPEELLSETQTIHKGCAPHVFAFELAADRIRVEFFVRNLKDMTCSCNAIFTPPQIHFAMEYADRLLEELGVRT